MRNDNLNMFGQGWDVDKSMKKELERDLLQRLYHRQLEKSTLKKNAMVTDRVEDYSREKLIAQK